MIHVLTHSCPPVAQTNLIQALQDVLLLVLVSYFFIQDACNILSHALLHIHSPKIYPNIAQKTMQCSASSIA